MNPKEFSWAEDQQVTVTNPTDKPYSFKVHNKEYVIGAHKNAKMPGYIAWVYVYGMASQLCQRENDFGRWNEEGFRQEYYERLVVNVEELVQEVTETAAPAVNTFEEDDAHANLPSNTPSATDAAAALAGGDEEEQAAPEPPADDEPDETETPPAPAQQQSQQPSAAPSTAASQDSAEEAPTPPKPAGNTSTVKPMTTKPKAKALQAK